MCGCHEGALNTIIIYLEIIYTVYLCYVFCRPAAHGVIHLTAYVEFRKVIVSFRHKQNPSIDILTHW